MGGVRAVAAASIVMLSPLACRDPGESAETRIPSGGGAVSSARPGTSPRPKRAEAADTPSTRPESGGDAKPTSDSPASPESTPPLGGGTDADSLPEAAKQLGWLLPRVDQGACGSAEIEQVLVQALKRGGVGALGNTLELTRRDRGAGTLRPSSAAVDLMLAVCAFSAGDEEEAGRRVGSWARGMSAVPAAFCRKSSRSVEEWPLGRDLSPVGWTSVGGTPRVPDCSPSAAASLWGSLRDAHGGWRVSAFAEWLEVRARTSPEPTSRAEAVMAVAALGYADLVDWESHTRLKLMHAGREEASPSQAEEIREIRALGLESMGQPGVVSGWPEWHGRWFLRRFLVDRDWGDDAAAVANLVEKGRTLLRAPESK
ncbi:MAG: hypothetical protein HMLKMBBP_01460 [Planctomycetes bacterium]|nr:hypothetical protein [Planctomycetota bacterium]